MAWEDASSRTYLRGTRQGCRALIGIAGTMVMDVPFLLDLADHRAAAGMAGHQAARSSACLLGTARDALEAQFTELLGQLRFDDEVLEWVRDALHCSHTGERREHDEAIKRLEAETKCSRGSKNFPAPAAGQALGNPACLGHCNARLMTELKPPRGVPTENWPRHFDMVPLWSRNRLRAPRRGVMSIQLSQ